MRRYWLGFGLCWTILVVHTHHTPASRMHHECLNIITFYRYASSLYLYVRFVVFQVPNNEHIYRMVNRNVNICSLVCKFPFWWKIIKYFKSRKHEITMTNQTMLSRLSYCALSIYILFGLKVYGGVWDKMCVWCGHSRHVFVTNFYGSITRKR